MAYEWQPLYPPRTQSCCVLAGGCCDATNPVIREWMLIPDAIAQYKLNGSRNLVVISPMDKIEFWGRDKHQHRVSGCNYIPSPVLMGKIRDLKYPRGKWNVFDSELMHFKTSNIKNSVLIFDVLVWDGEYLVGRNYTERLEYLSSLGMKNYSPLDNLAINGMIWQAESHTFGEWSALWETTLRYDAIEGLVLKRTGPVSRLKKDNGKVVNNDTFMCRVRKPHKNFQ